LSEDRRKKEWIIFGAQNNRQLGKIVKKKKKKILIDHWQMQSKESKLTTEISKCNGCIRKEEEIEGNCQQWIRVNSKINVVSDIWIEKSNNKIKVAMNQITEKTEINNLENKE